MQRADVAAECLEVERSCRVDPAHERARVGDRERGVSRRERVPVEEGERLARFEVEFAQYAVGKVGVQCEVGLTDRPERADPRHIAVVQRADVRQRNLGPGSLVAGGESVRMTEERCAHDLVGSRRTESDEVTGDRGAVERRRVSRAHVGVATHPDARGHAVCRCALP